MLPGLNRQSGRKYRLIFPEIFASFLANLQFSLKLKVPKRLNMLEPKRILLYCCFLLISSMVSGQYTSPKVSLLDHRDRINIKRINVLNTEHRETNLSITPDGRYLYFMSMRGGQIWTKYDYMNYGSQPVSDGDIWYSEKRNGQWTPPKCLPFGINTDKGEDEPNISPDGRTVYFQSWRDNHQITGGPYYSASMNGNKWGQEEGLGGGITEFFKFTRATDGMSISPDGRTFIVAAGDDYEGNMDLYLSVKDRYGWRFCRKLPISTPGNERSVFIAGDGKTIYFASDGYGGFGGLDIYKTVLQPDGSVGEIINLGAPFNTPKDDFGFILTADGQEAYFVRNDDIFFADLREADPKIKPGVVSTPIVLKGTVVDSLNRQGLDADILIVDNKTKRLIRRTKSNRNGSYEVSIPGQKKDVNLIVMREDYNKKFRYTKLNGKSARVNFQLSPTEPLLASSEPIREPDPPQQKQDPAPTTITPPALPKQELATEGPKMVEPIPPEPKPTPTTSPKPKADYSFSGVAQNNLILLLDVSASMRKPDKLTLFKNSLGKLLGYMRPEDMISVIVYSGESRILLESVSASQKDYILNEIERVRSSGSTKGKNALRKAYRLGIDYMISGGNNRIIMATDGAFNVPELYPIAQRNSTQIKLSIFSFGKLGETKLNELSRLAELGGGDHTPISYENIDEALLTEAKAVRE